MSQHKGLEAIIICKRRTRLVLSSSDRILSVAHAMVARFCSNHRDFYTLLLIVPTSGAAGIVDFVIPLLAKNGF